MNLIDLALSQIGELHWELNGLWVRPLTDTMRRRRAYDRILYVPSFFIYQTDKKKTEKKKKQDKLSQSWCHYDIIWYFRYHALNDILVKASQEKDKVKVKVSIKLKVLFSTSNAFRKTKTAPQTLWTKQIPGQGKFHCCSPGYPYYYQQKQFF